MPLNMFGALTARGFPAVGGLRPSYNWRHSPIREAGWGTKTIADFDKWLQEQGVKALSIKLFDEEVEFATYSELLAVVKAGRAALATPAAQAPQPEPAAVPVAWAIFTPDGNARLWGTLQPHVQKAADAEGLTVTPLYAHPAPQPAPAGVVAQLRDNSDKLALRAVFELCEATEDMPDSPADDYGLQRFRAGQRFEAKRLRRGIGTWYQDTFCGAAHMGEPAIAAALSTPVQAVPLTCAARDVLAERRRQVDVEGWTPEHDDQHSRGQMATAAACYAMRPEAKEKLPNWVPTHWPWDDEWWKPGDRRRMLVKAGALILAEIERLDRVNGITGDKQHG